MSPELLELLAAERDRLDRQMRDLRAVRNRLDDCITEAREQKSHPLHLPAGSRNATGSAS